MRKFLAVFFGLALFIPLAACGGGDDDESSSDRTTTTADEDDDEETTTTEGDDEDEGGGSSEFCGVIEDINDADFDELDFEDPEALGAALDALEELRDAAPEELEDDVAQLVAGFEFLAENIDELSDPETAAELEEEFADEFEDFDAAGERVDDFSLEECGITVDGETADDDGGATDDTVSDSGSDDGEDTSLEDFADEIDDCEGGDMAACDDLFLNTPADSEAERIGATCGGRSDEEIPFQCEATFG